jgi:hypothetical protein
MSSSKGHRAMWPGLVRTACFLLGFWALANALGSLADAVAPMNVYAQSQAERFSALMADSAEVEAIALGNSHSEAIDFGVLGLQGHRLARGGTDLFEVKLYAQSVTPVLPKLRVAFIAISYFSFARNNLLFDDTRNLRIELYALLPTWRPLPGDHRLWLLGKLQRYFRIMSLVRPDNWHDVFMAGLTVKTEEAADPMTTSLTPWGTCAHYTASQLEVMGNDIGTKAASRHLESLALDPLVETQAYEALAQTVELLQSHGVRVVLFTPPYYAAYNQRFSEVAPAMINNMYRAVENLQAQYAVEYYDAAALPAFSTHPELFFNSDHLNECGMRGFAAYLQPMMAEAQRQIP